VTSGEEAFADGWRGDAIEPATMDSVGGGSNQAWLATMTRGAATDGGMA
jgi:hypothetical protein